MTTAVPVSVTQGAHAAAATTAPTPAPAPSAPAAAPDSVGGLDIEGFNSFVAEKAAAPKAPEPKPDLPKADSKPAEKPAEEEPDLDDGLTGPEVKAEEIKPTEEKPKAAESFRTPKELREAFKTSQTEKFALLKTNSELKKRIEAIEKNGAPSPQVEAITKELETVRARRDELENAIKGYDYTKSSEYQQKYAAPLNDAIAQAQKAVGFLKVIVPGADQGDGTTTPATTRAATWGDFRKLYEMEPGDVDAAAVQMFGAASHRIVSHLDKIRGLGEQADEAAKNSAKLADESKQHQVAKSTEEMQRGVRLYTEAIGELSKKFPKVFGEIEGDKEANEVRSKGLAWADRAMSGEAVAPEERARRHAELRMRAGVVPLLLHQKKQLATKLAEAEAKLKGYESTAPKRDAAIDAPKVEDDGDMMKAVDSLPRVKI